MDVMLSGSVNMQSQIKSAQNNPVETEKTAKAEEVNNTESTANTKAVKTVRQDTVEISKEGRSAYENSIAQQTESSEATTGDEDYSNLSSLSSYELRSAYLNGEISYSDYREELIERGEDDA